VGEREKKTRKNMVNTGTGCTSTMRCIPREYRTGLKRGGGYERGTHRKGEKKERREAGKKSSKRVYGEARRIDEPFGGGSVGQLLDAEKLS